MKAFLGSVVVALVIAVGAAFILGGVQKEAGEAFATKSVRNS